MVDARFFSQWLNGEADNYFARNPEPLGPKEDPVLPQIDRLHAASPLRRVLELGAGNGWRLSEIADRTGAKCYGIEASAKAVKSTTRTDIHLRHGVAPDDLHDIFPSGTEPFDLVIVGFIQYLLPRDRVFNLAAEVDRLVVDNGFLIAFDFLAHAPERHLYHHDESFSMFKMDPSAPWAWSPNYVLLERSQSLVGGSQRIVSTERWACVDTLLKLPWNKAWSSRVETQTL